MVFSQLSAHEKDAFFGLLDEYFTSRPDLLTNIAKSQAVNSAAGAARDTLKNPATRNAALDAVKSGLNSSRTSWNAKREASPEPTDEAAPSGPGRVAAAAASLMSHPRFGGSPTTSSTGPPKPPTRKPSGTPTSDDSSSPLPSNKSSPIQRRESATNPLSTARTFGSNVDVSSAKGFFTSVKGPSKSQPLADPSNFLPPPSSGTQKNKFPPPPARRVTPDPSPAPANSTSTPPAPPPPPRRPAGEWAEVLYDFSGDPGDLDVKESQRILIVERSSDDWWTAELDGQRGLVPASYVKIV